MFDTFRVLTLSQIISVEILHERSNPRGVNLLGHSNENHETDFRVPVRDASPRARRVHVCFKAAPTTSLHKSIWILTKELHVTA